MQSNTHNRKPKQSNTSTSSQCNLIHTICSKSMQYISRKRKSMQSNTYMIVRPQIKYTTASQCNAIQYKQYTQPQSNPTTSSQIHDHKSMHKTSSQQSPIHHSLPSSSLPPSLPFLPPLPPSLPPSLSDVLSLRSTLSENRPGQQSRFCSVSAYYSRELVGYVCKVGGACCHSFVTIITTNLPLFFPPSPTLTPSFTPPSLFSAIQAAESQAGRPTT